MRPIHRPHSLWLSASGVFAHPYASVGGGGPGVARPHRSLGIVPSSSDSFIHPDAPAARHLAPRIVLFGEEKKKKKKETQTAPEGGIELSFVGTWPSEWDKKSEAQMLDSVGANDTVDQAVRNKRALPPASEWSPNTEDFLRFAKTGQRPGDPEPEKAVDLKGLLYRIGKMKAGTVHRVYLFTHADEERIGLSGHVKLDSPYFDGESIDPDAIFQASDDNLVFGTKGMSKHQVYVQDITLDRVRGAFQKDAEVIIFGCHSGTSEVFLEKLTKLLGVKVRGFTKGIKYTLYTDNGHAKIINRKYGFEGEKAAYDSFRDLIPFARPQ